MTQLLVRSMPCTACPYRKDCPSGLWAQHEYDKLREYDGPTGEQPLAPFHCHATPEHLCHGWAVVHSNRGHENELLALRVWPAEVPPPGVPLFDSGSEAAEHGERDIAAPKPEAREAVLRLLRKHPRLAEGIIEDDPNPTTREEHA